MSISNHFADYKYIQIKSTDETVCIEVAPRSAIPVIFNNAIYALCQQLEKKGYKSLSIELRIPTGGVPIKNLCPATRDFIIHTENDRITATTYFGKSSGR